MASHCTYRPEGRHGSTTRVLVHITVSYHAWSSVPRLAYTDGGRPPFNLDFWVRSQNFGKRLSSSSCLSVCLSARSCTGPFAWDNSDPTRRIFTRFDIIIKSIENLTLRGPCIVIYSDNESQRDALFLKFI
jgi:hypothetical protein